MSLRVNTNTMAFNAYRNLTATDSDMGKSLEKFSSGLRINRAGGPPDARTPIHSHPGSEAIYVLRGQVSQRTDHGVEQASAGEVLNAHAPEMAMQLTSSGRTELEQLVMFVVDAERPFSSPARFRD